MKTRVLIFLLLLTLIALSGCGKSKEHSTEVINPQTGSSQAIENPKEFLDLHKKWTLQLEDMAGRSNSIYNEWIGGKISTEQFITNIKTIYEEMRSLKRESKLHTEFNLNDQDKQKVNYDAITEAYSKASKNLNDFLYRATLENEEKIKANYEELIKGKYNNDISALKKLLEL